MLSLIHPTATASPSASIGSVVMIEAKGIDGTNNVVDKGCIIRSGPVAGINAKVDECCHAGFASTVLKCAMGAFAIFWVPGKPPLDLTVNRFGYTSANGSG